MVWIPDGALVAGTPPDALPRLADQEIAGKQFVMKGFYIDVYPYPDEEGAIPLTNVTQSQAQVLCEARDKRLCSELEWERACKGPDNQSYEYGREYRSDRCGTGGPARLRPSGLMVGCVSDFGVRDLHGGVWEWTDSPWGRGDAGERVSVRGGNGVAGELFGRCAHAAPRSREDRSGTVGFRCCAGPRNVAEVTLDVTLGAKLTSKDRVDAALSRGALRAMPEEARKELGDAEFRPDRQWTWRPVGNEELLAIGGCAGVRYPMRCGVLLVRRTFDRVTPLAWASSGFRFPSLHADKNPKELWLLGGDYSGLFKQRIVYHWGNVTLGARERRVGPLPQKEPRR
jgi:hypothetical protein